MTAIALVAQLDRASDFESEGREFESLRARQQLIDFDLEYLRDSLQLDKDNSWGSTGATRRKISAANSVPKAGFA